MSRKGWKVWTADEDSEFTRMWLKDVQAPEMAEHFKCSRETIYRHRIVLGLAQRSFPRKHSEERKKRALPLYPRCGMFDSAAALAVICDAPSPIERAVMVYEK